MILMLSTLLFAAVLNCGCYEEERLMAEGNTSPDKALETSEEKEDAVKISSNQREEDVLPHYLQSDFHDYITSNQGPTYNYEASKKKPKDSKKFQPLNLHKQRQHQTDSVLSTSPDKLVYGIKHKITPPGQMYAENSKSDYSKLRKSFDGHRTVKQSNANPEDSGNHDNPVNNVSFIHGIKNGTAKPVNTPLGNFKNHISMHDVIMKTTKDKIVQASHIHPDNHENEYPVPEDRLPLVDVSVDEDQTQFLINSFPKSEKGRKPRAVANFPGYFLHKTPNKRNGMWPQSDLYTMMSTMKDIDRQDNYMNYDLYDKDFSPFLLNPLPILAASILPLSMIFAAVVPAMIRNRLSNANGNVDLVTTTATGNRGKNSNVKNMPLRTESTEAVGKISPRSQENECITKAFCKMINSDKHATFYTQNIFSEIQKYVDGYWLDPFGMRTVLEFLKDGRCDEIKCQ